MKLKSSYVWKIAPSETPLWRLLLLQRLTLMRQMQQRMFPHLLPVLLKKTESSMTLHAKLAGHSNKENNNRMCKCYVRLGSEAHRKVEVARKKEDEVSIVETNC